MRRLIRAGLSALLLTAVVATPAAQADRTSGFKLEEATIDDIQEAFDGELTCVKLTKMYLARIAAYEDGGIKLNSITTVNPLALTDAAALDRERRRHGPRSELHCIPVLLKDNVDTFDMPTSNGSVILKRSVPPDDAFIAAKLRGEGALILGKAAMGEFAGGSYNTIDGQVVNPYNLKRQTGGSSAGSGAALAANIGVLAIGTDTSTSVRGPASFTGIVGLRPTTGLISRDGIAPKNLNFDSAGPMARTVTDAAEMLSVVAAPDGGADPLNAEVWGKLPPQLRKRVNRRSGTIDYTKFLKKGFAQGRPARRRARLLRRRSGDRRARRAGVGRHAGAGRDDRRHQPRSRVPSVLRRQRRLEHPEDRRLPLQGRLGGVPRDAVAGRPQDGRGLHPDLRDGGQPVAAAGGGERAESPQAVAHDVGGRPALREPHRQPVAGGDRLQALALR
jgi:hypothetical protein